MNVLVYAGCIVLLAFVAFLWLYNIHAFIRVIAEWVRDRRS